MWMDARQPHPDYSVDVVLRRFVLDGVKSCHWGRIDERIDTRIE